MFVAGKSPKDPIEYVPFLNELKNVDANYMRFSVDKFSKRYESALEHLSMVEEKFEECMKFIQDPELYLQGMRLLQSRPKEYKIVTEAYANFLASKKKYQEAGLMYTKSKNYQKALESYVQACNWQDAVVAANKLDLRLRNSDFLAPQAPKKTLIQ